MKIIVVAAGLLAATSVAAAAETVTYRFRGLVEHSGTAYGGVPAGYGAVEPIAITVDRSVLGTVSGDAETYGSAGRNANMPDPIVSIEIGSATIAPSPFYDFLSIQQSANRPSVLVIFSYDVMRGACTFTFTGGGNASLAIRQRIYTLDYETSTLSCNYPSADVEGDMTSLAIPSSSAGSGAAREQ